MISGEKTGLRAITREDLPRLMEWRNRPHYRCYFREHRELAIEDQNRWFEEIVRKDRSVRMFSIVGLEDEELIGACGLCYIDSQNQNADLSIYIGKDDLYIDEDLAVDAANVLIGYGFEELNLHRIWAEIYSTDDKKQAFFASLGFSLEGRHRQTRWVNAMWVDSLYYGLLREEYRGR